MKTHALRLVLAVTAISAVACAGPENERDDAQQESRKTRQLDDEDKRTENASEFGVAEEDEPSLDGNSQMQATEVRGGESSTDAAAAEAKTYTLGLEGKSDDAEGHPYVFHMGRKALENGDTDKRHELTSVLNHWGPRALVKISREYVHTPATAKRPAKDVILVKKKVFTLATAAQIDALVLAQKWTFKAADLKGAFLAVRLQTYFRELPLPRPAYDDEDQIPWKADDDISFSAPVAIGEVPHVAPISDSAALGNGPLAYSVETTIKGLSFKLKTNVQVTKKAPLEILKTGSYVVFQQETFGSKEVTGFASRLGVPMAVDSVSPKVRYHICESGGGGKVTKTYDCKARIGK